MKVEERASLVFVTTEPSIDPTPVAEAICGAEGYDLVVLRAYDSAPLDLPPRRSVAGFVVFGTVPAAIREASLQDGPPIPLIAVGGTPPAGRDRTCWLSQLPGPGVLQSLLRAFRSDGVAGRPQTTPRRKADAIVGNSKAVSDLHRMLDRVAPSIAPVLITGESGTGKELVARALHFGGPRASSPFIAINCAAIPETLFEAELFGYDQGAFTGALSGRPGAFEAAKGGTIFLDEIGEMPMGIQAKLLRVLDTGEVTRLGSSRTLHGSARVVAATNRNLERDIAAGQFREDLFYRIRIYPVHIPPLREHLEDIPAITRHHLRLIAEREGQLIPRLTGASIEKLLSYSWPGNVRELVGTLERAFLLADMGVIDRDQIRISSRDDDLPPPIPPYRNAKADFEVAYYTKLLRTAIGNISLAARLAQKTRKEIYDAIRRLELDAGSYR